MANCKNCLHNPVCDLLRINGERDAASFQLSGCDNFKDRARFVELPCKVGDTVYGKLHWYGEKIHECKVVKSKVCQFKDGSLHYFLDLEFYIIDHYYNDGRQMRCGNQAVFGEDYGTWNRVYLTREEAEKALEERRNDGTA